MYSLTAQCLFLLALYLATTSVDGRVTQVFRDGAKANSVGGRRSIMFASKGKHSVVKKLGGSQPCKFKWIVGWDDGNDAIAWSSFNFGTHSKHSTGYGTVFSFERRGKLQTLELRGPGYVLGGVIVPRPQSNQWVFTTKAGVKIKVSWQVDGDVTTSWVIRISKCDLMLTWNSMAYSDDLAGSLGW